jgi:hypothetical protein
VSFCAASGEPVISVAVSAFATDEQVLTGRVRLPRPGTNVFFPSAIPRGMKGFPVPPEQAALTASRATGRRVAEVPELIMRNPPFGPQLAMWKVTLELNIMVHGSLSATSTTTREVFAGFVRAAHSPFGAFIERPDAPGVSRLVDRGVRGVSRPMTLQVRAGVPIYVEPFSVEGR